MIRSRRSVFDVVLGLVASLGCAGCMTSPNEGDVIAPGSSVSFSGFHTQPSATVRVQAYRPAIASFQPFAQATTSTSGFSTAEGPSYPWSTQAVIPSDAWEPGLTGRRATLRAVADDVNFFATESDWLTCYSSNGGSMVAFAENCALFDANETHVYSSDYRPFPLRADVGCPYGTFGCNVCLNDVPATFARASGSKDLRHQFYFVPGSNYSLNGLQPDDATHAWGAIWFDPERDHLQSATRIPGLGHENWLAVSRNARDIGDGAIYLVLFDGILSHGDAWKWAYSRASDSTSSYYYYRIPGTNHTGGMQALGPMLFAANDCDGGQICNAFINVFDVRDPARFGRINQLVIDGTQDELTYEGSAGTVTSRAAAVAAVRLSNGHHLVFIRGREADQSGWFFESDGAVETGVRWRFIDFWNVSDLASGAPWYPWENVNFVSECGTGRIYMVAMGTSDNKSFLYRVDETPTPGTSLRNMNFTYVAGRGLNTSGPGTSTRYGAGVHVTPNRNLVSYVTDKFAPFEIEEFRYHADHLD